MFVQRDSENKIMGAYALEQPGIADEELSDLDPELVAFLAPKPIPPDPRDAEIAELKAAVAALKKTGVLTDAMIAAEKVKAAGVEAIHKV